jgi:NAD(P)-dependent dehydrogenase (short-subunit alcohol dehydrogenase family)
MTAPAGKTALIIGASRGLGYAQAAEYQGQTVRW